LIGEGHAQEPIVGDPGPECLAPGPLWAGHLVGRAKPHRQPPFGPLPQPQKWGVNLNFDSRGEKQLFAESCLGTHPPVK